MFALKMLLLLMVLCGGEDGGENVGENKFKLWTGRVTNTLDKSQSEPTMIQFLGQVIDSC
jgi:hypothetical protein